MGWREALGLGQQGSTQTAATAPEPPLGDTNWRNVAVVGESHYQEALWAATGLENTGEQVGVECTAELIPEPENPHDPRAVMVKVQGRCVGYLSRGVARRYRKRVAEMRAAGQSTICDAFIGGLVDGDENPNLGITLKFPVQKDGDYRIEPGAAELAKRILAERESQDEL